MSSVTVPESCSVYSKRNSLEKNVFSLTQIWFGLKWREVIIVEEDFQWIHLRAMDLALRITPKHSSPQNLPNKEDSRGIKGGRGGGEHLPLSEVAAPAPAS